MNKSDRLNRRSTHLTLAFTVCLAAFAVDVSLPAIPQTIAFFGAPDNSGQQIVTLYLAGYASGQIPMGLLADRFGRLPILYAGVLVFLLASIMTVVATSMDMLLLGRFVQGVSSASAPVIARAMARDIADGKELAKLTALLVTSLAVSTLFAPIFGAAAMYLFGWRATYAVCVLMGLVTLVLMSRYLAETHKTGATVGTLSKQFVQSCHAFIGSRQAIWGTALVAMTFFAYMSIVAGLAQIVVDVFGMSGVAVGFVFAGAIVFYLASAKLGRLLIGRFSTLQFLQFGFAGYAISAVMCAAILLFDIAGFWMFWCSLIPFLMGMGLIFSNATAIALEPLPKVAGFAASILGTLQIAFATIGAGLTGMFYDRSTDSLLAVLLTGSVVAILVFLAGRRLLDTA